MPKHDDYTLPLRSRVGDWLRHTWAGFKLKRYQVRSRMCSRYFFTEKGALHFYTLVASWGAPIKLLGWDRKYIRWHVLGHEGDKQILKRSRVSER